MLKNPSSRTEATVGASEYETFQSSSKYSGGVPMRFLLNPAPEPNRLSSGHSLDGPGLPAPEPVPPPLAERIRRDAEHLDRVRTLEEEIHMMKQLMSFTNGLDDRDKANQMAREIEVHGISDPLLHKSAALDIIKAFLAVLTWFPYYTNALTGYVQLVNTHWSLPGASATLDSLRICAYPLKQRAGDFGAQTLTCH